jgi:polygalacturonase
MTMGSDLSGGIHHVYVHDMRAEGNARGIRFKSAKTRGGVIDNILLENIEIRDVEIVFEFNMNWFPEFSYPELPTGFDKDSIPHHWNVLLQRVKPPEKGFTRIKNVYLSNVEARGCKQAFMVEGFPEVPVEGIRFDNLVIESETAGSIKHAKGWQASNARFIFKDNRSPDMINCQDMEGIFTLEND